MPDGQVQWVDNDKGIAQVARRGREYRAPLAEFEAAALVPGARVHFDIVRDDGVEGAANVRLRRGSNAHRRRFGDLTGARQPGAKAPSASADRLGVDVTTQPAKVVRSWLETLAAGDLDDALALYAPDAVIHCGDTETKGRRHLTSFLADEAPRNFDLEAVEIFGLDEQIRVDWPAGVVFGCGRAPEGPTSTFISVDHGHIVEEWDHVDPASLADEERPSFVYVSDGPVSETEAQYIHDRFEHLISGLAGPVLFTRVKISVQERGRHRERPVAASTTIDLNGHVVRAHIGAATVTEAVDELVSRVRRQVKEMADRQHSWPTGQHADPATWQHGKVSEVRPDHYERPVEEREIVRHKSYAPDESTVAEALWDMGTLDYDFFLFTEMTTSQDCLLARDDDGVCLHMIDAEAPMETGVGDVSVAPTGAPTLAFSDAVQRLDEGAEPYVFFLNEATSRGNVVYRRYDGHYGVITPSNGS